MLEEHASKFDHSDIVKKFMEDLSKVESRIDEVQKDLINGDIDRVKNTFLI